jgi:cobalt/nickel transport protein
MFVWLAPAQAHFGMLIPETSLVQSSDRDLDLTLAFAHPFEMHGMELVKPKSFAVWRDGRRQDLLPSLAQKTFLDHKAWQTTYSVKRPGMHIFAFEPEPYFEPAEDAYIIHYTKTVVAAFGQGEEWRAPVGLKTEIVPLTRPWGNYAGNAFQGVVLKDGKPVPYVRVEVEFYNQDKDRTAPDETMITQEVLADGNGVFSFTCPWPGWWGFAALTDADEMIEGKAVEHGAVLWIELLPAGK